MSSNITMDFSDMFKTTSGPRKKAIDDQTESAEINVEDLENVKPNVEFDSVAYVKRHLASLNYDVSSIELNKYLAKIMETMLSEKSHWQNQASLHSDECAKLRNQIKQFTLDKERESSTIESLKKDQVYLNNKIASLNAEHRETRNHWLTEKSDLEGRMFQIQGLNTTMTGTLKKKEKDFEKLQNQYAKLVKDNERGNKAIIQISQPLRKNITQSTSDLAKATSMSLLRDAEVIAARNSSSHLESENRTLRSALENVQTAMNELQSKFEQSLLMSEAQNQANIDQLKLKHEEQLKAKDNLIEQMYFEQERNGDKLNAMMEQYRTISLAKIIEATQPTAATVAAAPTVTIAVEPSSPTRSTNTESVGTPPVVKQYMNGTPSAVAKYITASTPGTIAKKYLEGTPGARPVSWVVEQANTEVKRLRSRVEDIGQLKKHQYMTETDLDMNNEEHALIKQKLMTLRAQLSEAMCVIQEQDRLIHEALIGKPYSMESEPQVLFGIDEDVEEDDSGTYSAKSIVTTATTKLSSDSDNISFKDSDFLPPASPATIQILEGYGWSSIPRIPQSLQAVKSVRQQNADSLDGPSYDTSSNSGTTLQF